MKFFPSFSRAHFLEANAWAQRRPAYWPFVCIDLLEGDFSTSDYLHSDLLNVIVWQSQFGCE